MMHCMDCTVSVCCDYVLYSYSQIEISRTESRTKTKRSKPVRSKTTASNLAAPTSGRASSVRTGLNITLSQSVFEDLVTFE